MPRPPHPPVTESGRLLDRIRGGAELRSLVRALDTPYSTLRAWRDGRYTPSPLEMRQLEREAEAAEKRREGT